MKRPNHNIPLRSRGNLIVLPKRPARKRRETYTEWLSRQTRRTDLVGTAVRNMLVNQLAFEEWAKMVMPARQGNGKLLSWPSQGVQPTHVSATQPAAHGAKEEAA